MEESAKARGDGVSQLLLLRLLSVGLFASAISHLVFPNQTERLMSKKKSVQITGARLPAFAALAVAARLNILAMLLVVFGLPRVITPAASIRFQQRIYSGRIHGAVLLL